jgi:hypothetical protein
MYPTTRLRFGVPSQKPPLGLTTRRISVSLGSELGRVPARGSKRRDRRAVVKGQLHRVGDLKLDPIDCRDMKRIDDVNSHHACRHPISEYRRLSAVAAANRQDPPGASKTILQQMRNRLELAIPRLACWVGLEAHLVLPPHAILCRRSASSSGDVVTVRVFKHLGIICATTCLMHASFEP